MIIDGHCHIGDIFKFHLDDLIIKSMDKYHVDFALISNIEGVENTDTFMEYDNPYSQIEINQKSLNLALKYPTRLGVLFWCMPRKQGFSQEVEDFIRQNRKYIYGLKFHPFYSNLKVTDDSYAPYFSLAERLNLPVMIHTATDDNSLVRDTYLVAQKWPGVNFVMCHLGLGSDNQEAIEYIAKLDNLYGDTAWVSYENAIYALKRCPGKIFFGTDNPIDGMETYQSYSEYFSSNDIDLMCNNILKLINKKE